MYCETKLTSCKNSKQQNHVVLKLHVRRYPIRTLCVQIKCLKQKTNMHIVLTLFLLCKQQTLAIGSNTDNCWIRSRIQDCPVHKNRNDKQQHRKISHKKKNFSETTAENVGQTKWRILVGGRDIRHTPLVLGYTKSNPHSHII